METSPETIKVIKELISIVRSDLASTKKVSIDQDKSLNLRKFLNKIPSKDEQNLLILEFAIATLIHIISWEPKLEAEDCDPNYENWMTVVLQYLKEFNKYGNCYISSCGEALLKTFGIKNGTSGGPL